jgi:hypothetical protein
VLWEMVGRSISGTLAVDNEHGGGTADVDVSPEVTGAFGIRCEVGAYVDGPIGGLMGKSCVMDVSDKSCIDRSAR